MTSVVITDVVADGGRTSTGAPPKVRRDRAWLGLVPFLAFLVLFLFIPAISVFRNATNTEAGSFSFSAMKEAFTGQNLEAFKFSVKFSAGAAAVGVLFGTLLAYAGSHGHSTALAAQPRHRLLGRGRQHGWPAARLRVPESSSDVRVWARRSSSSPAGTCTPATSTSAT